MKFFKLLRGKNPLIGQNPGRNLCKSPIFKPKEVKARLLSGKILKEVISLFRSCIIVIRKAIKMKNLEK